MGGLAAVVGDVAGQVALGEVAGLAAVAGEVTH